MALYVDKERGVYGGGRMCLPLWIKYENKVPPLPVVSGWGGWLDESGGGWGGTSRGGKCWWCWVYLGWFRLEQWWRL